MILLIPFMIIHNAEEYMAYEAFIKEFKLPEDSATGISSCAPSSF